MSYGYERIRYELKYPVAFEQAAAFLRDLAPHLVPDAHGDDGRYVVYSVYFDTRTLTCYHEKLDGFAGRVKFRLRTYPGDGRPQWFLESKERVRHYIAKHRLPLSVEQADRLLATHLSPGTLDGIVPPGHPLALKLAPLLRHGVLYPTVGVYYRRNAYVFHGARDVRVTLDHNLLALPGRTPTDRLPGVLPIHPRDRLLIEVKGNGWMPVEVMDAVCREGLVARAFSKYCACVEQAYHLPASA
jgi:hypothetical protein